MCKCSTCKFGEYNYENPDIEYFWCTVTDDFIDIETAECEKIGCGYYVSDMDDDD